MNGRDGLMKAMTVAAVALSVMWGAGVAKADIDVLDAPLVPMQDDQSGSAANTASISYHVSTGTKVLVVGVAQKAGGVPTFTWNGSQMTAGPRSAFGNPEREATIFYLFNPAPGAGTLAGSNLAGTYWGVDVYTLSGVDTNAGIKTGIYGAADNNAHVTINGVVAGSAAATMQACDGYTGFNGITFTGTGGTAMNLWQSPAGYVNTICGGGLITGLSAGSDLITGTINPYSGASFGKNNFVTVVFAPEGAGPAPSPIMGVQGNSIAIAAGDGTPLTTDGTDFGSANVPGGTVTHAFTILNTGTTNLNLSGSPKVAVSGVQASEFTVTSLPATPVAASGSTSFQVTFAPAAPGLRQATLSIANDDAAHSPYTFAIQGTGTATATLIPVTAKWCVGGNVGWDATTSWSTVNTAATPHPGSVPSATDTAVFNIDWQNAPMSVTLNSAQAASGMVFRSTGSSTLLGGSSHQTLTLGTGGLRVVSGAGTIMDDDGGSLSMSLSGNQTWLGQSGNQILLQATGVNGGGNALTLVRSDVQLGLIYAWRPNSINAAFTNMPRITLAEGAALEALNNVQGFGNGNRIGDATDIISYGGTLSYPVPGYGDPGPFSETVNALRLVKGEFRHAQDGEPGRVNIFTYAGGLTRTGPATVLVFADHGNGGHEYFGTADAANRVIIAGQPDTSFIGPWAIVEGHGVAGYGSTVDGTGYPVGVYANPGAQLWTTGWGGTDINDPNGVYNCPAGYNNVDAFANVTVGALVYNWGGDSALRLTYYGTYTLTIVSGGLSFDSSASGVFNKISGSTVTAGTGSDTNLFVFVTQAGAKNERIIDSTIIDNGAGKVGLVKSGAYALTLTQANTYSGNTTINDGTIYLATAGSIASSPVIELLYGNFANQYYAGQAASGAQLDVSDQTSTWTLGSSQTLKGNGAVIGNVSVNGTVAPGDSTGILSVDGNMAFANNATLQVNVENGQNAGDVWGAGDTWNAGYGRLQVYGAVNLGANAILDLEVQTNATLHVGDKLFIVTGASALSGQFKTATGTVLNPGDTFTAGGKSYQISYTGKIATQATTGGNDVVLQVQALAPPRGTVLLLE